MFSISKQRLFLGTPPHLVALGLFFVYSLAMTTGTVMGLNVALPVIIQELDTTVTMASWIQVMYFLALAGGTFALGRVSNVFNKKKLIIIGVLADIPLMLLVFFTDSIVLFIISRFFSPLFRVFPWLNLQVIGIGGFPEHQRGRVIGISAAVQGLGMVIAPALTGWVTEAFGWRWLFMGTAWAFVPIAILMVLMLSDEESAQPKQKISVTDFDLPGTALMMIGVMSLLMGLQFSAGGSGLTSSILLGGIGIASIVAFIYVETRAVNPIIILSLFKVRGIALASSQAVVIGLASGAFMLVLPFLLINGYGWSMAFVGTMMVFMNIARPVSAPVAGWLSDRFGSSKVIFGGTVIAIIGQLILATLDADPTIRVVIGCLMLWGLGHGAIQPSNLRQLFKFFPKSQLHMAPSTSLTFTTLGSTSGQAIAAVILENSGVRSVSSVAGISSGSSRVIDDVALMLIGISVLFGLAMVVTQIVPRVFLADTPDIQSDDSPKVTSTSLE